MLQTLTVKNLALFKDITVEFNNGLNILTGETGAGKSVLVGSALLALGGRYSSDLLRRGAQSGYVELAFSIDDEEQLKAIKAVDSQIEPDEGMIVISRRLMDGRSLARINGENVTQKTLRALAGVRLDVHGQHDAQILLESEGQLALLDAFGADGLEDDLSETKSAYEALAETEKRISEFGSDSGSRSREIDLLAYELDEIEKASLKAGEDEELERDYARLTHSQAILEGLGRIRESLNGENGAASEMISRSVRELAQIAGYDDRLESLHEQLVEIDELMFDVSREISDFAEGFEFSTEEVDRIGQRLDLINHLKNKYAPTIEQILDEADSIRERLAFLNDADNSLKELNDLRDEQQRVLSECCERLSGARKRYAKLMEEQIRMTLSQLNFADNRFEIRFERLQTPGSDGYDRLCYMIGPNPGEAMHALSETASGGELSRIMLAIKSVMAERDLKKTLIFDEIDSGISGRTAGAVAEKLASIARTHQVICITHLAQIAAMADHHYLIEKEVTGSGKPQETLTRIRLLDSYTSIDEIARILADRDLTQAARDNAKELKDRAEQYKKENSVRSI